MTKVIVAPMDWGLGHAARCAPVVRGLQERGWEVVLASAGRAAAWLRQEFPHLPFEYLPPYEPVYGSSIVLSLLQQWPRLHHVVREEHQRMQEIINSYRPQLILSDNRYGCWSHTTYNILLTHQLKLPLRGLYRLGRPLAQALLNRYIAPFQSCWVPDDPRLRLAGELTQSERPVAWTGPLSRFQSRPTVHTETLDVLAVVSGPEPHRSHLEARLQRLLPAVGIRYLLVGGRPEEMQSPGQVHLPHLSTAQLQPLAQQAKLIVCRSGYSSLMDFFQLKKRMLIIPTPGQPEQEYLAEWWQRNGWASTAKESTLSARNIEQALTREFKLPPQPPPLLPALLDELTQRFR